MIITMMINQRNSPRSENSLKTDAPPYHLMVVNVDQDKHLCSIYNGKDRSRACFFQPSNRFRATPMQTSIAFELRSASAI